MVPQSACPQPSLSRHRISGEPDEPQRTGYLFPVPLGQLLA